MIRIVMRAVACLVAVVALLGDARPATAAFLNTTERGWYDHNGTHTVTNDNYFAGTSGAVLYRNFFVLDLTSIVTPVDSATLRLWNPQFGTSTGPATYSVHEVTTSIPSLTAGTGGMSAFADLADGTTFGSVTVSAADSGSFIDVTLNSAGIAALNANLGGLWAVGGQVVPFAEYAFAFSGNASNNPGDGQTGLEYTLSNANPVPAPPGAVLAAIGVFGLLGGRAFRRRTPAPTAA